jgi:cysteine protease ATG4
MTFASEHQWYVLFPLRCACLTDQLPHKIFSIQDEPPSWDQDDAAGLESVSEPELSDGSSARRTTPEEADEEVLVEPDEQNTAGQMATSAGPLPSEGRGEQHGGTSAIFSGAAHLIGRSTTPNSIPVMVERPSTDMPQNVGREVTATLRTEDGGLEGEDVMTDIDGPQRPHAREPMLRHRTDSWVKPDRPDDV